jgi:hypothetical protein
MKKENEICAQVWGAWKAGTQPQNFYAILCKGGIRIAVGDAFTTLKASDRQIANALDLDFLEGPAGITIFPEGYSFAYFRQTVDVDTIQDELFDLAGELIEEHIKGIAVILRNTQWMHYIHCNPIKAVTEPGPYDKGKIETLILCQTWYERFKHMQLSTFKNQ